MSRELNFGPYVDFEDGKKVVKDLTFRAETCVVECGGNFSQQRRSTRKVVGELILADYSLAPLLSAEHLHLGHTSRSPHSTASLSSRLRTRSSLLIVPTSRPCDWRWAA